MTGVTNDNKLYLFAGVPPVGALHAALTIDVKVEEIVRAAPIVRQVVVAFGRLAVVEPGLHTAHKSQSAMYENIRKQKAYLVARDVVDLADGAVGLAEVGPQVGLRVRSKRGNALCEVLHNLVLGS